MSAFRNKYFLIIAAAFATGVLFSLYQPVFRTDKTEWALAAIRASGKECPAGDRTKSILCLKKKLAPAIRNRGIRPFMEALGRDFKESNFYVRGGEITRCHDIAHAIGQAGGETTETLREAMTQCTELCTFGCYHGAVEGYLARGGNFIAEVPNLCPTSGIGIEACLHGLGHGAASVAGFDLRKSLDVCDLVGENGRRMSCSTGVFMELYEPSTFTHPLVKFPEDIVGFCSALKTPYDETCLLLAGLHEYGRSNDVRKAFVVCGEIADRSRREGCQKNIGANLYFAVQGDAEKIKELCGIGTKTEKESCLLGAVGSSVVSSSENIGREICAGSTGDFAGVCEKTLNYQK